MIEPTFEWSTATFLIVTVIIILGSVIQSATGMGAGFLVVPLAAFISIDLVPAPMVFASLALTMLMSYKGRKDIDRQYLPYILSGLLLGVVSAGVVVAAIPLDRLGVVFGILILTAVLITLFSKSIRLNKPGVFSAGAAAGFIGTVVGVGAPILALIYQNHKPAVIRSTLAVLYFVSSLMMLTSLFFAGRFGMYQAKLGMYLIPGFMAGYFIAPKFSGLIDKGKARPAILILSGLSAIALILKSL